MRIYRYRRLARSSGHQEPSVSLTPLIDTVLVLLVIFMVTTPVIRHAIKVDLASGDMQEAQGIAQDVIITIDHQMKIYCNTVPVTEPELLVKLPTLLRELKTDTVFIDVDGVVESRFTIELIDKLKHLGGVGRVILETQQKRTATA